MTQAMMTEIERNEAIVTTIALNEQSHELGNVVAEFRNAGEHKEMAADLGRVADSFAFEVREKILDLVKANLGPQQQANLMLVLRKTGEWVNDERAELQRPLPQFSGLRITTREAARKLRDLDYFELFLRKLAKDILRAMADFNFQKSRMKWRKLPDE